MKSIAKQNLSPAFGIFWCTQQQYVSQKVSRTWLAGERFLAMKSEANNLTCMNQSTVKLETKNN